jgi:hypothetical protein
MPPELWVHRLLRLVTLVGLYVVNIRCWHGYGWHGYVALVQTNTGLLNWDYYDWDYLL